MQVMPLKLAVRRMAVRLAAFLDRQTRLAEKHDLQDRGLLSVGRHTYGLPKIWMSRGSECKVAIGSFCSISPEVQIIAGGIHPAAWVSTYPFRIKWRMAGAYEDGMPATRGDLVVGSDVWIGTQAMLLSGVTIGHGAIVAARAVVTHSVPPYAIVAGAPAKIVRYRFEDEIIARLLKLAWWDWDDEKIRQAVPLLSSGQMDQFLAQYERPRPNA